MRRKTSVVVWILLAFAGVIVLCVVGIGVAAYWFVRNPAAAVEKMVRAANPDAEIVNVDGETRRIRIRDRRTGKEMSLSFDEIRNGRVRFEATDESGKEGSVEIGGGEGKLPAWVPVYPGSKMESHITGRGEDNGRAGEGGMYSFTSSDAPSKVMAYYQDQARELGMKVELTTETADGGHMKATEDGERRSLVVIVGTGSGGGASGSVTFARNR